MLGKALARPLLLVLWALPPSGCACGEPPPPCAQAPFAPARASTARRAPRAPHADPEREGAAGPAPAEAARVPVTPPDPEPDPEPEPTPEEAARAVAALDDAYRVADADLDELKRFARTKKAPNDALLQYLDAVMHWYAGGFRAPAGLDAAGRQRHAKYQARIRKEAAALFVRCLTLESVQAGHNLRVDVNIAAARKLGQLGAYLDERARERLSKRIRRAIEKPMLRPRGYVVAQTLLEDAFGALAQLGSTKSLEWMIAEFAHGKETQVIALLAAHKAMPLFDDVPGALRYEVVQELLKSYAAYEAQAARPAPTAGRAARLRVWQQIGPGVVAVVQHYAGDPRKADGTPRATLRELHDWFRAHKNPRKPPWVGIR